MPNMILFHVLLLCLELWTVGIYLEISRKSFELEQIENVFSGILTIFGPRHAHNECKNSNVNKGLNNMKMTIIYTRKKLSISEKMNGEVK